MIHRSVWRVLVAEIGYFVFILLGVYGGYRFWKVTMFSKLGKEGVGGEIFSYVMLLVLVLAMIPIFLLSLRRMLLKAGILTKAEYRRYLWSRTWFIER